MLIVLVVEDAAALFLDLRGGSQGAHRFDALCWRARTCA
jgi:hypothetical protein